MDDFVNRDARMWAMFCHLSAFVTLIGLPFGNILGPLLIWVLKRDEYPEVDEHGRESLNFQISLTLYFFVAAILSIILIGIPLLLLLLAAFFILTIMAGIKAYNGESFRYPFILRLIEPRRSY